MASKTTQSAVVKKNHKKNTNERKPLQILQSSVNGDTVLVGSSQSVLLGNMSEEVPSEKPRRSQRKRNVVKSSPTLNENVEKLNLAGAKKSTSSVAAKPKKTRKANKTTKPSAKQTKGRLQQRKITFCCVSKQDLSSCGSDSETAPDEKEEAAATVTEKSESRLEASVLPEIVLAHVPNTSRPSRSRNVSPERLEISDDLQYLIRDGEPPESFWQEIIFQRETALERTLLENARLADEIEVLQAENSLLLAAVDSGRELADYVTGFASNIRRRSIQP